MIQLVAGLELPLTVGVIKGLGADSPELVSAIRVLRTKQGDITALTDEQVQKKYNGSLTPGRIKTAFWPGVPTFHFLRTCYAKFCDLLFDHSMTYNYPTRCFLEDDADASKCSRFKVSSRMRQWPWAYVCTLSSRT